MGIEKINRSQLREESNMNDNRITNLKYPSHGTDAATKRWVLQQVKDYMKQLQLQLQSQCNQINGYKTTRERI